MDGRYDIIGIVALRLVLSAINRRAPTWTGQLIPGVGDDPGVRRIVAGQEGRVTRTGLCRRMRLIAISKHDALIGKAAETAGEIRSIFVE